MIVTTNLDLGFVSKRFTNISEVLEQFIHEQVMFHNNVLWKSVSGILTIYCPHTTAGVRILENESLALLDVDVYLDRVVPNETAHDKIHLRNGVPEDERINGKAHLKSLFINTSESIIVNNSELVLGQWQTPFFVELDLGRPRSLVLSFIGEGIR